MQIEFEGAGNAALDLFQLVEGYLVVCRYLDIGKISDDGIHILHARSNAAEFLWHAVAHQHPLQFQVLLAEGLFLVFGRSIRVGGVEGARND